MRSIRLYWPALIVATFASFLFEAIWYSLFLQLWLKGIGHDMQWLEAAPAVSVSTQFSVALLCALITATVLSIAIQSTGEQTALRGIKVGIVVWLGFIATTLVKSYIFEVRPVSIYGINLTYGLLDFILIGAIVGAWKRKPKLL